MKTREVKQFAWHGWVSGYLVRHERAALIRMMQTSLETQTREQRHEPLPGTFDYRFIWPGDDDVWLLSDEDREFMGTRDVVWARTMLRCVEAR